MSSAIKNPKFYGIDSVIVKVKESVSGRAQGVNVVAPRSRELAQLLARKEALLWSGGAIEIGQIGGMLAQIATQFSGPSLEGTNSKLTIPTKQYDTAKKAGGEAGTDTYWDYAKSDQHHEVTGPIGQVNGAKSGQFFPGLGELGPGKMEKGKYPGDQGSYIEHLTQQLPKGSHLAGYYTTHIFYDPSRLRSIDAPNFQNYWKFNPVIVMKSPGFYQNWDLPRYSSYP